MREAASEGERDMTVKTVSPEGRDVVRCGPVGSTDPARNGDYRFLDLGLPVEIARLKELGCIDEAREACLAEIGRGATDEMAALLRVEHHRMGRLARQYCVSRERALELIRSEWPGFTDGDLDALIARKRIDWRIINGEQRFLENFLDSLRVYPAEVPGLKPETPADTAVRDAMLGRMRREGAATRVITVRARISVPGARPGEVVRVWLPIPAASLQQSDIELVSYTEGGRASSEDAPARTMYWESATQREFEVVYRYRIDATYVDGYSATAGSRREAALPPTPADLEELGPHIVFTPYLRSLTASVTAGLENGLDRARAIYDYLTRNIDYRYQPDYAQLDSIADNCAKSLRGDCGVMALTFITMCRIAGVPARWQSGLYVSEDYIGPHDWAMFYTDELGWRWADVSFGSSSRRSGDEARRRHHFGNLDPWRMVANTEYQAEFEPMSDGVRWDPYDSQLGEATVDGRGCDDTEMLREVELLEMREP